VVLLRAARFLPATKHAGGHEPDAGAEYQPDARRPDADEHDRDHAVPIHIGVLFVFGNPEWKPIATGYLGLLLMGGCFLSLGLFISSLTKNQIVAGIATFAVFLMLWVISWISTFVGPTMQAILGYLSLTEHFDDFAKGIIDTKHVIYYLSFMAFGLFLTAKSVDSERWRG
jgi:ABC-2 type transport system permease protein